jgi:hypothetical protein
MNKLEQRIFKEMTGLDPKYYWNSCPSEAKYAGVAVKIALQIAERAWSDGYACGQSDYPALDWQRFEQVLL